MTDMNDISDPQSDLDTAGAPYSDGLDTEVVGAQAQQTVTNDAVAGETVLDTAGPPPAEAQPTADEAAPANDGYLAPRNELAADVDLGDQDPEGGAR